MGSIADDIRDQHEARPGEWCRACHGSGSFEAECCNGAYGCSCRGQVLDMGPCGVCGGSGVQSEDSDPNANIAMIDGYGFIGSGPTAGLYADLPRMGRTP